ncbi:hypothetical protein ABK040_006791 [Willaertia magna]
MHHLHSDSLLPSAETLLSFLEHFESITNNKEKGENKVEDKISFHISTILKFLNNFSFLFLFINSQNGNAHENNFNEEENHLLYFLMKDYFTKQLPLDWQTFLLQKDVNYLIEMVNYTQSDDEDENMKLKYKKEMPKDLFLFLEGCKILRLKKNVIDNINNLFSNDNEMNTENNEINQLTNHSELIRHMSPKKIYEIERLALFISKFTNFVTKEKELNLQNILDIGTGKGYLSDVLFSKFNLNIIAVDHNENLIEKLQNKMDKKRKQKNNTFKAIASHLDCNRDVLSKNVKKMIKSVSSLQEDKIMNCIVGLHTCGDLSAILMDIFINQSIYYNENNIVIDSMVNIGCCYQKLNEKYQDNNLVNNFNGFPQSNFVKDFIINKIPNFQLTKSGLILGTSEMPLWKDKEQVNDYLKRNAFRCAMEYYLHSILEKDKKVIVYSFGSISDQYLKKKNENDLTFTNYAFAVLQRLQKNKDITNTEYLQQILNKDELIYNEWKREIIDFYYNKCKGNLLTERIQGIDIFWTLRAMIGPMIETLILLDRFLYLKSNVDISHVDFIRLFNEDISPRGIVLFAFRK